MEIPRLETERLLLREWRDGDLDAYAAMSADPDVMRFLGAVLERAAAWRSMALHAGHWSLRGYGNWALERRADGALIGRAGFWQPEGWPGLEIGWKLARDAWGQGFATEAARASLEWGWRELHADEVIAIIHPDNAASTRLAGRLGFRQQREHMLHGERVVIHAVGRPSA